MTTVEMRLWPAGVRGAQSATGGAVRSSGPPGYASAIPTAGARRRTLVPVAQERRQAVGRSSQL